MNARISITLLALLCVVAGIVGAQAERPAQGTGPGAALDVPLVAPDEEAPDGGFLPLLERAAAEAAMLVALGESRERNLLRIRAGQNAMTEALAETDAWLAEHSDNDIDASAVAIYRDGAATIRVAMAEAQAGFLRLDFDRVARATATLREGEAALRHATALLSPQP